MSWGTNPNGWLVVVTTGAGWRLLPQPATSAATSARAMRTGTRPTPGRLPRGAWVRGVIDVAQALGGEVRVDLRRGDVGVAEHLLDRAQVAAAREQVRGEGVAQRVRAHLAVEPDRLGVALDDLVEALPRQL